jgi:hypothetical protein
MYTFRSRVSELFSLDCLVLFVYIFQLNSQTLIFLDASVVMPPIESLLNFDVNKRLLYFFEVSICTTRDAEFGKLILNFFQNIQPGDLVYGQVVMKSNNGVTVNVQFTTGSAIRFVCDVGGIKVSAVHIRGPF